MTAPPRPWDDRSWRRRVHSHVNQAAVWAPTTGAKDACLETFMEQQDWDDNAANQWRETFGTIIQNGATWHRKARDHDGHPASEADSHWGQGRAKQLGAAKPTTSRVPAAVRLGTLIQRAETSM